MNAECHWMDKKALNDFLHHVQVQENPDDPDFTEHWPRAPPTGTAAHESFMSMVQDVDREGYELRDRQTRQGLPEDPPPRHRRRDLGDVTLTGPPHAMRHIIRGGKGSSSGSTASSSTSHPPTYLAAASRGASSTRSAAASNDARQCEASV